MTKQRLNPPTLSRAASYTQVVTAEGGKMVFLAGQTPTDTQGQVVGVGDLRAQAPSPAGTQTIGGPQGYQFSLPAGRRQSNFSLDIAGQARS